MSLDARQLVFGRLVYNISMPALDDAAFDRISKGFGQHYIVTSDSRERFAFERGEGYLRLDAWDAFGYVDGGNVERLRELGFQDFEEGGNVILMPARFAAVRFELTLRVALIFSAFTLGLVCWFIGVSWPIWLMLSAGAYAITIGLVLRSLKRKLAKWIPRQSWN